MFKEHLLTQKVQWHPATKPNPQIPHNPKRLWCLSYLAIPLEI